MLVAIGNKEFEVNNKKLDIVMKSQKAQFLDIIEHYKQKGDIQGLLYVLFSMKDISEKVIEDLCDNYGIDNIGDIITAET